MYVVDRRLFKIIFFIVILDVCYLDHAGATLYSETQLKNVFEDLQTNVYGNPHSLNHCSKESSDLVDHIRRRYNMVTNL